MLGRRYDLGAPIADDRDRRRAHSEEEIDHLKRHGASKVIMGEYLIAQAMIADAREAVSVSPASSTSAAPPATAPTDGATAEPPRPT